MAEDIKCPECGMRIPDDSCFCDQCGAELLVCVKCGNLGTDAFCDECGGPMVSRKNTLSRTGQARTAGPDRPRTPGPDQLRDAGSDQPHIASFGRPRTASSAPAADTEGAFKTGASALRLKLRDGGLILTVRDGALIGRAEGDYAGQLASFNLISRRHARFTKQGRQWLLTDLGSTNGCYITDVECKPHQPMPFKKGDMVDIATYIFDVV